MLIRVYASTLDSRQKEKALTAWVLNKQMQSKLGYQTGSESKRHFLLRGALPLELPVLGSGYFSSVLADGVERDRAVAVAGDLHAHRGIPDRK